MILQEDTVDDEKLTALKEEWGTEADNAVVPVLEMNKHNPSARYPVPELWKFKEDREARSNWTCDEGYEDLNILVSSSVVYILCNSIGGYAV
jgi:hypothetical protein